MIFDCLYLFYGVCVKYGWKLLIYIVLSFNLLVMCCVFLIFLENIVFVKLYIELFVNWIVFCLVLKFFIVMIGLKIFFCIICIDVL